MSSSDSARNILIYDGPNDAPEVNINYESNLFFQGVDVYRYIQGMSEVLSYVDSDLTLEPSYPEWVINYETDKEFKSAITWEVSVMPASLGGSVKPGSSSGTKENKPRLRDEIESRDKVYQIFGQKFDAFFSFTIWSQSASEAEKIAQWFQFSFMPHYGSLLGAEQYHFHERKQDKELLKVNNLLQTRTLTYYVMLCVNSAVETQKIQEVKIKLDSQV